MDFHLGIFHATEIRYQLIISDEHPVKLSSNPVHGEVYLVQHYVIKFVSDLRHVGVFFRVLRFPPPIILTSTI
jgi:hypothetical protein